MHTETLTAVRAGERTVDPWLLLTGGSVGLVAGFAIDLWRLGAHRLRHRLSGRPAAHRWPRSGACCPCDAGAR